MQEIYYHGFEDATSIFRLGLQGHLDAGAARHHHRNPQLRAQDPDLGPARPGLRRGALRHPARAGRGRDRSAVARAPQLNRPRADADNVQRIARMIADAERPLLLAGGGVVRSRAATALKAAAEALNIPTVTTLPAKGMLPEDHQLSIGTLGRSGFVCAARASREADLASASARASRTTTPPTGARVNLRRVADQDRAGRSRLSGGRPLFPLELGLVSDAKLSSKTSLPPWAAPATRSTRTGSSARKASAPNGRRRSAPYRRPRARPRIPPASCTRSAAPAQGRRVYIDIGDVTQYAEAYMKICTPGAWQVSPGMAEMGWASSGIPGARGRRGGRHRPRRRRRPGT